MLEHQGPFSGRKMWILAVSKKHMPFVLGSSICFFFVFFFTDELPSVQHHEKSLFWGSYILWFPFFSIAKSKQNFMDHKPLATVDWKFIGMSMVLVTIGSKLIIILISRLDIRPVNRWSKPTYWRSLRSLPWTLQQADASQEETNRTNLEFRNFPTYPFGQTQTTPNQALYVSECLNHFGGCFWGCQGYAQKGVSTCHGHTEQRALGASGSIGIFAGLGFFRSSPLRGPGTVWGGVKGSTGWGDGRWQVGWLGCFGRTTFWMKKEDLEVKNNGWDWTNTMGKESTAYICWECGYSDVNFIIFNHFHSFVGWYIF